MVSTNTFPDLRIPDIVYSRDSGCWDLACLLYPGGAITDVRWVGKLIDEGKLGIPDEARLPLVERIHDVICAMQALGKSRATIWSYFAKIRYFYAWAETTGTSPTLESVRNLFVDWCAHLYHRVDVIRNLNSVTAYGYVSMVANVLNDALGLRAGLLLQVMPPRGRKTLQAASEQVTDANSFIFGNALIDICNALSRDQIQGKLPINIKLRTGEELVEWSNLRPPDALKTLVGQVPESARLATMRTRERFEADTSYRKRFPLINLRIEAELLIFIAQTGMNLSQAYRLRVGRFSFASHIDGYEVKRVFKARRQGPVEFSIFSEYRPIFERYLSWRNSIFPDDQDGLLFPLGTPENKRSPDVAPTLTAIRDRCKRLGLKYVGPRALRNIRVNWLHRHIQDDLITSELGQHSVTTMARDYIRPNFFESAKEISRFHAFNELVLQAPAPGVCSTFTPTLEENAPSSAPIPDCASPAGCLFCRSHRDLDNADHVWSLASYRHLKIIERSRYAHPEPLKASVPCDVVIERVTAKLEAFKQSSPAKENWVIEAITRIDEENYHPMWDGFIRLME